MDKRGPPGQRKSPKFQSPETRLVHVCQSPRRDCRVSTNPGAWIGAQRRVRRIRLHYHPQEVWSRCTFQLRAHICDLCLPTERGNMAADRGQSGHQAHIYEMCLSAERGIDMETGKEVLFALPLKVSKWVPLGPACPKLTFCFQIGQPYQTSGVLQHTERVRDDKVQEQDWRQAQEQKSRAPARPSDGITAQSHSVSGGRSVSDSKSRHSGQSQTHVAMTQ